MQVVTLHNFIYAQLEQKDFRWVGNEQPYLRAVARLNALKLKEQAHYDSFDRVWIVQNEPQNRLIVSSIQSELREAFEVVGDSPTSMGGGVRTAEEKE